MEKTADKSHKRFIELDALRGIAAMIVLVNHYTWAYDRYFSIQKPGKFYFEYGNLGVEIFFLISGFVIFMTLERINTVKEFAIARFSRLYPTYWICMFLTLICITFFPFPRWGPFGLIFILKNLTMLQGFIRTAYVDQVYWSLCVELAFYAIMGVILYFKKLKYIEIICVAWLLLALGSNFFDYPLKKFVVVILILKNAPLFIAGIMFYKIKTKESTFWNHVIIAGSFIAFQTTYYFDKLKLDHDYYPVGILVFIFLFFYYFAYKSVPVLKNSVLLFLGAISYPLYLLHNVIGYSIIYRVRMYTDNQIVYTIIPTAFAISLAYLVSRYIEKPSFSFFRKKLSTVFKVSNNDHRQISAKATKAI